MVADAALVTAAGCGDEVNEELEANVPFALVVRAILFTLVQKWLR